MVMSVVDKKGERLSSENARFTVDLFPGFFSALKDCYISWKTAFDDGGCGSNGINMSNDSNYQLRNQVSICILL